MGGSGQVFTIGKMRFYNREKCFARWVKMKNVLEIGYLELNCGYSDGNDEKQHKEDRDQVILPSSGKKSHVYQ